MEQKESLNLNSGIPVINSYSDLLKSTLFHEMEKYSNYFLNSNRESLTNYRRKWVFDPFHSWSRQWEYPYVYQIIHRYIYNTSNKNKVKILDAGSGVTFFPYYINSTLERAEVDCCDFDEEFIPIISAINEKLKHNMTFHNMDIRNLELKDNSYDVVYCISVLEHADDYDTVLKEFNRILKPDGILVLTFDISIDGFCDISIEKAIKLIGVIEKYYIPIESMNSVSLNELSNSNLYLTTDYIKKINKNLLPWSCSTSTLSQITSNCFNYSMILKIINRIRHPNPNLTIYCNQYQKRGSV